MLLYENWRSLRRSGETRRGRTSLSPHAGHSTRSHSLHIRLQRIGARAADEEVQEAAQDGDILEQRANVVRSNMYADGNRDERDEQTQC